MANSYLQRTTGTPTSQTKFTLSAWVKRSALDSSNNLDIFCIFSDSSNRMHLRFQADNIDVINYGGSTQARLTTNRKFRDTNGWYHIVWRVDTTLATADDRQRLYVNGVQETSFSTRTNPSQDFNMGTNWTTTRVGLDNNSSYFDGYISHIAYADGQSLAPTEFGETDSTSGIWKFKSPSGVTWGTNGFHLKFENSAALGTDSSGNSNTFTVNGNLKQSISTPTNMITTFSRNSWWDGISTNGNTTTNPSGATAYRYVTTGMGVSKGKWYWEMKLSTLGNYTLMGITDQPSYVPHSSQHNILGSRAYDYSVVYNDAGGNGNKYNNAGASPTNTPGAYMAGFSAGDILTFALDCDNNTLKIGANGNWANGSGATNQTFANTTAISITAPASTETGFYFPASGEYGGADGICDFNFGEGRFGTTDISSAGTSSSGDDSKWEYDCPSGYYGLNTKNLNTYG